MREVMLKAQQVKDAAPQLALLSSSIKDQALRAMAQGLLDAAEQIKDANGQDVQAAKDAGRPDAFLERLTLTDKRIREMAEGLEQVAALPDPVGETLAAWKRPNGLEVAQVRVPLGVLGIIYESRPNVTADAVGLSLKTGNGVVLRGGSEALHSNRIITQLLADAAYANGIPPGVIALIEDTDRKSVVEMMKLNGIIDVLIPRGGAGLIRTVVENATVPVIETGIGNCHVYVDAECDPEMAVSITVNSKTHRPSVCNAAESLLVDSACAAQLLPVIAQALMEKGVSLRGCTRACSLVPQMTRAEEADWETEYLDLIMAVKVVDGLEEAIAHINRYGSRHSEAIVTTNYFKSRRFVQAVDAAAVYINASTRFTDGFEFGFGAEIGISTQKLHARGPMGLKELTTIKYIVQGTGQIRE